MPFKMYTEIDLTFLGAQSANVGMLIAEELNQVLDKKHQTKLLGIVGCFNPAVLQYVCSKIWDNRIYVSRGSQSCIIIINI